MKWDIQYTLTTLQERQLTLVYTTSSSSWSRQWCQCDRLAMEAMLPSWVCCPHTAAYGKTYGSEVYWIKNWLLTLHIPCIQRHPALPFLAEPGCIRTAAAVVVPHQNHQHRIHCLKIFISQSTCSQVQLHTRSNLRNHSKLGRWCALFGDLFWSVSSRSFSVVPNSPEKTLEERKLGLDQREREIESREKELEKRKLAIDDIERKVEVETQMKLKEVERREREFEKERENWPNMAEWKASLKTGLDGYLKLLPVAWDPSPYSTRRVPQSFILTRVFYTPSTQKCILL